MNAHRKNYLVAVAALVAAASLTGGEAYAQACSGPPVPGSRLLADQRVVLQPYSAVGAGENLVNIPAFSPINTSLDPNEYGFKGICEACGLTGTASEVFQIDGETGMVTNHRCEAPAAPRYQPCQGVVIRLAPGLGPRTCRIPVGLEAAGDVEGSWNYAVYGNGDLHMDDGDPRGDQVFGIPQSISSDNPERLCRDLRLPKNTRIIQIDAATGAEEVHRCRRSRARFALKRGGAVLIQAPGAKGVKVAEGRVAID